MSIEIRNYRTTKCRRGTSVVSATVVLALVAVTASMRVPQWMQQQERQTACEAISYLSNVHAAQEQFYARHGSYAADVQLLDLAFVPPTYFDVGPIVPTAARSNSERLTDSWSMTLTRYRVQTVYRPYSITCTNSGFNRIDSWSAGPLAGLRPRIAR